MQNKKQSTYLYNARKSLKTLGGALLDDYVPNTKSNISSIKDGIKGSMGPQNTSIMQTIKSKINNNPLTQFSKTAVKTAFDGIKTGKFYTDPLDIDTEFGGFDDSMFDIGDDFFFDGDSSDVDSDMQVSKPRDGMSADGEATMESARLLAHSMKGSITSGDRALIDTNVSTSRAISESINATIIASTADIKTILHKTDGTISTQMAHITSMTRGIDTMVKAQGEMLVEMKALREMSGEYFLNVTDEKSKNKEDDSDPLWYTALKKGEMFTGLGDLMGTTVRAVDSRKTQGAFSQIMNMVPLLTTMYGTNPFGLVKDFYLNNKLNEKFGLQDFSNKFDARVKSLPDMIDGIARTLSLSDNDVIRSVGDAIRTKPDVTSSIDTSKYDKNKKVFFDGITREAIVTVIPGYLSSMVSLLSGKERTVYDYNRGQFQTVSETKSRFYEEMPKLEFEYGRLSKLVKDNMPEKYKDGMDENRVDQFSQLLMDRLSERGYTLTNMKEMSYDKALENLNLTREQLSESDFMVFRDIFQDLETNESTYAKFSSLDKAMQNYLKGRNKYMSEKAKDARNSGLIHTINKSWVMDDGSAVGLQNIGGNTVSTGKPGSPIKPTGITYEHLMSGIPKVELPDMTDGKEYLNGEDRERAISMLGSSMKDEDINTIREFEENQLGGINKVFASMNHNAQLILSSKMFQKLGIHDTEWYKNYKGKSAYSIESILEGQRVEAELIEAGIEREIVESQLEGMGVDKATASDIAEVISNSEMTPEEKSEVVKSTLDAKGFFDKTKNKMKTSLDKAKDNISKAKTKTLDTVDSIIGKVKDHKETIKKVSKAAIFGGAAYGGWKMLKGSMVGDILGAFGMMSPIAMASVTLGAGIYAQREGLFDKLFGDSDKAKATGKKMLNVTKTALFGAGLTGGLNAIANIASGGALGMMAPVSMAISGLALGIAGESKGFKKMLFGTEDGTFMGNMKLWLFGDKSIGKDGVMSKYGASISKFMKDSSSAVHRFFMKDIVKPITQMYKPVSDFVARTGNSILTAMTGIPTKIGDSLGKGLQTTVMKPLLDRLNDSFISPMGNFIKGIFNKGGSILGKIISAPFKMIRSAITGKTDSDYFKESYGSSSVNDKEFKGDKSKYKENLKKKEELYKATKYDKNALDKAESKAEVKQIRKFMAKDAMGENKEEIKSKTLQERLAEYKDYNKVHETSAKRKVRENRTTEDYVSKKSNYSREEQKNYKKFKKQQEDDDTAKGIFGKGISGSTSKKYYYNQKDADYKSLVFGSGSVEVGTHGCGLMVMAQALSISTNTKITPDHIINDAREYQTGDGGLDHEFFTYIANRYSVPCTTYRAPNRKIIDGALRAKASIILTIKDVKTGEPHYVLITDHKYGEYIYSDPAREPNMKLPKVVLIAKATTASVIFPEEKQKAENISAPKVDSADAKVIKTSGNYNGGKVADTYDTTGKDEKGAYTRHRTTPSSEDSTSVKAVKSGVSSDFGEKIYKSLETFRKDTADAFADTRDDLELFLTGVAYNAEYIRRLLSREYGEVNDSDINGNGAVLDTFNRYKTNLMKTIKRMGKKGVDALKSGAHMIYDQTIGRVVKLVNKATDFVTKKFKSVMNTVDKAIGYVLGLPERIMKGINKFAVATKDMIKAIMPTKEQVVAFYKETKAVIGGIYKEVKSLAKFTFAEVKNGIMWSINTITKGVNFAVDKMQQAAVWTGKVAKKTFDIAFDLSKKAFNWFKQTSVGSAVLHPIKTVKAGLDKLKGKVQVSLSPKEVYIAGGKLNTVQTVEVVKAVGAVDLDYAESISKKIKTKESEQTVKEAIRQDKPSIEKVTSVSTPNPKTGAQYSEIKNRQDKDLDIQIAPMAAGEPQEKKKGFFDRLFDQLKTSLGGLAGIATTALGVASTALSLGALTDTGKDLISKGYEMLGANGAMNSDRIQTRGARLVTKTVATGIETVVKKGIPKIKPMLHKVGDITKNLFNKKTAMSTITNTLRDFFVNPKIRGLLGENFCAGIIKKIPVIAKEGAEQGAKRAAKGTLRMASYTLPPVGVVLDLGFLVWDITTGMTTDASRMFGVKSSDLTPKMRAIAGAVKGMQGFLASKGPLIVLAFIPTEWLVKLLYESVTDEEEMTKYKVNQASYQAELQKEMEAENAKRSSKGEKTFADVKEYEAHKNRSFISKAKDGMANIKETASNLWDKTKEKASDFAGPVMDVAKKMFEHSPMGLMFKGANAMFQSFKDYGFLGGIGSIAAKFMNTVDDIKIGITDFFTGEGIIGRTIQSVGTFIESIPERMTNFVDGIKTTISNFGDRLWDGIINLPTTIVSGVKELGNVIVAGGIALKDGFVSMGTKIYDTVTSIPELLSKIWTSIVELPERIINWGKEKASQAVDAVKDKASNIVNSIKDGYNKTRKKKKDTTVEQAVEKLEKVEPIEVEIIKSEKKEVSLTKEPVKANPPKVEKKEASIVKEPTVSKPTVAKNENKVKDIKKTEVPTTEHKEVDKPRAPKVRNTKVEIKNTAKDKAKPAVSKDTISRINKDVDAAFDNKPKGPESKEAFEARMKRTMRGRKISTQEMDDMYNKYTTAYEKKHGTNVQNDVKTEVSIIPKQEPTVNVVKSVSVKKEATVDTEGYDATLEMEKQYKAEIQKIEEEHKKLVTVTPKQELEVSKPKVIPKQEPTVNVVKAVPVKKEATVDIINKDVDAAFDNKPKGPESKEVFEARMKRTMRGRKISTQEMDDMYNKYTTAYEKKHNPAQELSHEEKIAAIDAEYATKQEDIDRRMADLKAKQTALQNGATVEDIKNGAYGSPDLGLFDKLDDSFMTKLFNFGRTPKSDTNLEQGGQDATFPREGVQDMNYDYNSLKPTKYAGSNADQIRDMYHTAKDMYGEKIASNLVRVAWAESNWNHNAKNSIGAEGLFQVLKSTRPAWGFRPDESPRTFSPVEQMQRVAPKLLGAIKRKGAEPNLLNMYSALHYPISVGKPMDWVLYSTTKDPKAYAGNKGIDINYGNKDGAVSMNEMNNFVMSGAKHADARFKALGGYGNIDKFVSQNSSTWNNISMGPYSFKDAGCGPSVMAMLLDSLGIKYDMEYLVKRALASKNGPLMGTPINYFQEILKEYGVSSAIFTDDISSRFYTELSSGKNPILLTESSSGSNHYIIGKDVQGEKIGINDPEKSNTEYVSMNDRRIRKAKAILVYKVKSASNILKSSVADMMGGAFGSISSLLNPYRNAHTSVMGNLEKGINNKLSGVVGKNDIIKRTASEFVRTNMNSGNSLINDIVKPINDVANAIGNTESRMTSGVNSARNSINSLANQPIESLKDVQRAVNDTKALIKDATKLAIEVPEIANKVQVIPKQNDSINNTGIERRLDEMINLLGQLVKGMVGNQTNLIYNGKPLHQTISGVPTPISNDNTGDKFYELINGIAKGSR